MGETILSPSGEREIEVQRVFAAPRGKVFAALTEPALIQRWLLGPDGWTMPVCEVELKPGGAYRYVWRHADGREMGAGGVFREIAAPDRLVVTERFDEPWYAGECVITTVLGQVGSQTRLTATERYESREARDAVLKINPGPGIERSYERLAELLASQREARSSGSPGRT